MRTVYFVILWGLLSCNIKSNNAEPLADLKDTTAESVLIIARNAHPDSLLAWENLIQYYRDNNNYPKALSIVDSAINKDSESERLFYIQGTLQYENEDTSAAIKSFEKAVSLKSTPENNLFLCTLYAETKNSRALTMADDLSSKWKISPEKTFFIKGIYYSSINDKLKAIQLMDECLRLNFTYMEAYREKALALYDLHKYDEALQVLNKAVTLQNSYEEGYYYIGKCLEKLNRYPDASEAYRKALLYDPNYLEAKEALDKIDKSK